MLGVQNDEIEAGQSEKLSDARRRPGQEAAEERVTREDALAKRTQFVLERTRLNFNISV